MTAAQIALSLLRPVDLADIVSEHAADANKWIGRVRLQPERRWCERLRHERDYSVWIVSWLPGQATGFHDHGGSPGAFAVVSGTLEEHRLGEAPTMLQAGDVRRFGPHHVHDVRNVSDGPAISVHAYSLLAGGFAAWRPDGLPVEPPDFQIRRELVDDQTLEITF